LNKFLINKATESGAKIYFGHALDENGTSFADDDLNNNGGGVGSTLAFNVCDTDNVKSRVIVACHCPVVACDGAGSRARYAMRNDGLTEFTETMLGAEGSSTTHGYKEMLFPKDSGLAQHGLHIWPRRTHMLMALANLDGSMTGTLYMDMKGSDESFEAISTPEKSDAFFKEHYPDAIELVGGMERATSQMLTNPSGILGTVRTTHWNHRGRVLLVGDAAHAIVPFYGQGMNSGFEDVYDLLNVLSELGCKGGVAHPPVEASMYNASTFGINAMSASDVATWTSAFDKIFIDRKPNGDAIAELALMNFEEMRDKVADRCFLLQKRVENIVENQFESKFRSMYAMVVYGGGGNITYENALRLGKVQQVILRDLIEDQVETLYALPEDEWTGQLDEMAEKVSMAVAEHQIDTKLVPLQTELGIDLSTISH
jgi:kynurenine 3-monooxygenase